MPLATPRLPRAQGRLSLALYWGPSALLDCIGTGAAAGWRPTVHWLRRWRGPGHAKRCPASGPCRVGHLSGSATVHVSRGAQRVHHLSDRSPYPPPPVSRNHLAQEPNPGSAVKHCRFLDTGGGGVPGEAGYLLLALQALLLQPLFCVVQCSFIPAFDSEKGRGTWCLAQCTENFCSPLLGGSWSCWETTPWLHGTFWLQNTVQQDTAGS